MRFEVVNISDLSEEDYRKTAARQSAELIKRLENCSADDIKRTLAGRLLLERMIKRIYGVDSLKIEYGANGKPLCNICFFSIAHSGDYAAVAVSDKPIGIDLQVPVGYKKREKYMLFSDEESIYVNRDNSEERFCTLWTMKEAYVKAIGGSLSDAAKISLVSSGRLNTQIENYTFKTEKTDEYFISVCSEE